MPADTVVPTSGPTTLRDYLTQQATKLQIPPDLALAITHTESGGRMGAISPKGATGFFQLMPETAKELGVDPSDPFQNIDGGLRYFKQQYDAHGGDVRLALAAYNAGPDAVARAGGKVPAIPETQDYVMKVLQAWQKGIPTAPQAARAVQATPPPAAATAGMMAPSTAAGEPAPPAPPPRSLIEQTLVDPMTGFGKGVAGTLADVGSFAERVTGAKLPDLPPGDITTRNTGEAIGKFAERTAEFALPASKATKISKAAGVTARLLRLGFTPARARLAAAALEGGLQAGAAASIAEVHGDDPTATAIISGAMPIAGELVTSMAPKIRMAAVTKMARYMERGVTNLTPLVEKDIAQAASDFIDLPLQRTWRQMARMTGKMQETAGKTLGDALKGPLGDVPVPIAPVYQELDNLVAESEHLLPVRSAEGATTGELRTKDVSAVSGDKSGVRAAVGALKNYLADYSEAYGTHMPARELHDVKEVWWKAIYPKKKDTIVTATGELLTTAQKEAMLRGGKAIMQVLKNDAPEIAKLDTAVKHAADLNRFTQKLANLSRKSKLASSKATYAVGAIGGAVGAVAGSEVGHTLIGMHVGYATGHLLMNAVTSPRYRLLPMAARRELAGALAAGRSEQVRKIITPIVLAATASQDNLLNQSSLSDSASASR